MRSAAYLVNAYLLAFEILYGLYVRIGLYRKFDTALVQTVNDLYIYAVLDRGEELKVSVDYRYRAVVKSYLSCFKIRRDEVHIKALLCKISVFVCNIYRCTAECSVLAGNVYLAVFVVCLLGACR